MRVLFFSSMTVSPGSGGGNTVFNLLEPPPSGSEVLYAAPGDHPLHWAPFPELAGRMRPFAVPKWCSLPGGNRLALLRVANRCGKRLHLRWARHAVVNQLQQVVNACEIQQLLLCPQSILDLTASLALLRKTSLPAVAWFMDDYFRSRSDSRTAGELWAHASRRFVISEAMQERFTQLYGGECEVLNNSVSVPASNPARPHGLPLRIAYAGAAHSYYRDTLLMVLREFAGLDGQVELDLYTHEELPPALTGKDCLPCHRRLPLPSAKLIERLWEYDVLLLLSSFRPEHRSIAETSLASKIADYLASGCCILAFGPPYAENIRYAQRHGFAEVVATNQRLRPTLLRLLHDSGRRLDLGARAYEFALARHDRRRNAPRLWRALFEANAAGRTNNFAAAA